jgi:hypothetical protein
MRLPLAAAVLALAVCAAPDAKADGCDPARCIGLIGYVPVLYSQSEIWWDSFNVNGKIVKNHQHVFAERGVPAVNATVTLDWEGLPLMISAEALANIDALGAFDPRPDNAGDGFILEHPKVNGVRVMHRGARLRILSYQAFPQTKSTGLFAHDEVVQDIMFTLVRYEGDPPLSN